MILQALVKEYENLAQKGLVSKPGWSQAKVSYAIDLKDDGSIKVIYSLKTEEQRGKRTVWMPSLLYVPEMVTRSSGVAANFLCDNAKYFLGIDENGTNDRVLDCFQAAKEKHIALLKDIDDVMAKAICSFFESWNPQTARENTFVQEKWDELKDGGNIIFCMGMEYAQNDEKIKAVWENSILQKEEGRTGTCLVTGQKTKIARIHRGIKGVPGAQSSGAALVSFNAPAFESYGKEQSYNAPVGKYAEFAYTTALNYLLGQEEYRFQLGDTRVVFWAESGEEAYQDFFASFLEPKPDNEEMLKAVFAGLKKQKYLDLDQFELNPNQKFYILGLAPNAARLAVRFFYEDSFGNILKHLAEHYQRIEIVKPVWEQNSYLGIRDMLAETVNQKAKDKNPISNMASMVLQAILAGNRYPASLYTDTMIRIRAEQGNVTWKKAAILKAYLIQNYHLEKGEHYMGLNEGCREEAYVLGRLFAMLEAIQMDANPGIKATIRDRYFNSACATPAIVFPILFKLKNSHIKKLERDNPSAKIYYEKQIMEIMGKLGEKMPNRLALEEQGQFDLGYYHQMQKKYEKREEK
jgi:CRISPR-associated protein Csd1